MDTILSPKVFTVATIPVAAESNYWQPSSFVVEDASPDQIVITYPQRVAAVDVANFSVNGHVSLSISLDVTQKIATLVLSTPVEFGEILTLTVIHPYAFAVTNNGSSSWTPQNLSATVISDTEINLTWSGGKLAKVERSTDGVNFTQIGISIDSYSDTTCSGGVIYYYRVKGGVYSNIDAAIFFVTDVDGNRYPQVTIGTQNWLVPNLKTTKYNDGSAIPTGLNDTDWGLQDGTSGKDGAFAQVDNNAENKQLYGILYNWFALINAKGLMPENCHFPTLTEINVLMAYLGGTTVAGGKLKEAGISHWLTPNPGDNSSKFTALGSGYRNNNNGAYDLKDEYGIFSSITAFDATSLYRFFLNNTDAIMIVDSSAKKRDGLSVRCISNIDGIDNRRFQDNFIENICGAYSISYGEPTALVSPDGNQIDLWFYGTVGANTCIHYTYSTDGLTFAVPVPTNIPTGYLRHHALLYNGVYYHYCSNSDASIHCFTSIDKLHYIDQGAMINPGGLGTWDRYNVANSFIWQENEGKNWYMFYDSADIGGLWLKEGLATAANPLGPWTKSASNPIMTGTLNGTGNFELPRVNNEVIKHNGKYYLYFMHGNFVPNENIDRAYSTDLVTWNDEGPVSGNRKIHDLAWSYGDQCLVEFKGKSYLFNNPSSQVDAAHIDCWIDNRQLIAMLALTP